MSDRFAELQRVAGPVSRETFEQLVAFEKLFAKWAARINLAAPSTLPDLWTRHILDSAQLTRLAPEAAKWVDLGSGGGFPGAVVAILLGEREGGSITLVESNQKKASFLRQATAPTGTARILAKRIEDAAGLVPSAEIVTARALAPLPQLLDLAFPWLSAGATGLFHKGRDYRREIEESGDGWQFDLVEHPSVIDAASVILEIKNLSAR